MNAAGVGRVTKPKGRNFSPWFSWMIRLANTEHVDPIPVHDPTQLDAWRDRCRDRLRVLLGRSPELVEPNLEVVDSVQCDGFRRDKIVFDTEATMSVSAYLLVPDGRVDPGPAILAQHGHGPGKDVVCGITSTEMAHGDYGLKLVQRGYVVLAPDLRCFGERSDWNPPDHYACDTNLVHAVMDGWSPLSQNLWDLARALDVLEALPIVDPGRIGMVGFSYGATMTLFLAAWDSRISAAAVSGFLSSWAEAHRVPWNMCGSQVLPGMLGQLEHVDLGSLVAPRPLLVETGTEDFLFPVQAATKTCEQLKVVYEHLGAVDSLVHDVFEGGHQWHGALAYPFLDRWLRGQSPASVG